MLREAESLNSVGQEEISILLADFIWLPRKENQKKSGREEFELFEKFQILDIAVMRTVDTKELGESTEWCGGLEKLRTLPYTDGSELLHVQA